MYLGNVQVIKLWVYGSSYSCQEEVSFFFKSIIKKPTFPQPFVCNHRQEKPGAFTWCPGFSAALLNLVNQRVNLRPEWKFRGKQPSNDWDIRQHRMMPLAAKMQLSNTRVKALVYSFAKNLVCGAVSLCAIRPLLFFISSREKMRNCFSSSPLT